MNTAEVTERALAVLRESGILLYPTDTVWGLGCDATQSEAIARIYELKQRPRGKSMIVLVECEGRLRQLVPEVPQKVWDRIRTAESPLTVIYENAGHVAPELLASDGSLGIRLTRDPWLKALICQLDHPLVSTSANPSGAPTPLCFSQVEAQILEGVDYAVPLRRAEKAQFKGSTILRLGSDRQFQILRA